MDCKKIYVALLRSIGKWRVCLEKLTEFECLTYATNPSRRWLMKRTTEIIIRVKVEGGNIYL